MSFTTLRDDRVGVSKETQADKKAAGGLLDEKDEKNGQTTVRRPGSGARWTCAQYNVQRPTHNYPSSSRGLFHIYIQHHSIILWPTPSIYSGDDSNELLIGLLIDDITRRRFGDFCGHDASRQCPENLQPTKAELDTTTTATMEIHRPLLRSRSSRPPIISTIPVVLHGLAYLEP